MADEAEVSAFEETVNARISSAAADLGRWLRPAEAAAHRCVADALADGRLDADAAHAASDKCMAPVSGVRGRFAEEMRGMQVRSHRRRLRCWRLAYALPMAPHRMRA